MRARHALHAVSLAALFLAAYAWFLPPKSPAQFGTNNAVRFYLAKSLALDGRFDIGRYYTGGIDAAAFNGRFYSGKAPAASFLAVPVIWALARASAGAPPDWVLLYAARLAVVSIPSVLMILTLHGFLLRRGVSCASADLAAAGYGLGTMAFPYSTEFVGHQLAAVFIFWCFLFLWGSRQDEPDSNLLRRHAHTRTRRYFSLFSAVLFAGLAVAADYQAAVLAAIIFLFLGPSLRRPVPFLLFALGCLPGAAMVLGYNYACFGDPLSFPYAHEAMPIARQVQGQGLFGVQAPRLVPLVKLLFSPWRGIFFGSPFLLLSIPGLRLLWREGAGGKRLAALCLCACGAYLLFNSSYGAWSGGASYGPRFLVPVIPFFVVPAAVLFARGPRGCGLLAAVLVACSVAFHFAGTAAGPEAHEHLRNPMREFLLPSLLRGNVRPNVGAEAGLNGAAGLLPLAAILVLCAGCAHLTGERETGRIGRRIPDRIEQTLLAFCSAAVAAMACLFAFHRTEETAFRYAIIGHSYDVAGDADAAIPFFEKALDMDPRDDRVIVDLTRILIEKGEYRKALEANIRALAARPGDAELRAKVNRLIRLCDLSARPETGGGNSRREHAVLLRSFGVLRGTPAAGGGR